MKGNLASLLQRVGLSHATQIKSGSGRWQLWEATEEHTFGTDKVYALYFDSRATWETVSEAAADVKQILPRNCRYNVVVQASARVAEDLPKLLVQSRATGAYTLRQLLQRSVERVLGAIGPDRDLEAERLFVDPDVRLVSYDLTAPTDRQSSKALSSLSGWLKDDSEKGPRVAVLVAKAGVGKTTMARQLFRHLRFSATSAGRYPIIVESDHWAKLSDRTSLSLWDVWRESLDVLYASTFGRDDLEMCVEQGLLLPIFDGFDELCTRLGSHFSATETLDQLLDVVKDTEGRILLTTRDTFWIDYLAEERRRGITHFELLAFNKPQTAKYFENRFRKPAEGKKRELANTILQRLGGAAYGESRPDFRERLTSIPLVVMLAAECADSGVDEKSLAKYGGMLDSSDPLEGVLMILFEREQERRRLAVSPDRQMQLLSEIAFECGETFSAEDLRLYASAYCGLKENDPQQDALQSHAVLQHDKNQFGFRFEFLGNYLTGRALVTHLAEDPVKPRVAHFLETERRGGSVLLERATDYLFAHIAAADRLEILSRAWAAFPKENGRARSGLLHLILEAAEREIGSGTREERTALLRRILGFGAGAFSELYVEGTLSGLDLQGVVFQKAIFCNAGLANCIFDHSTRFLECTFDGNFELEDCQGFDVMSLDRCTIGPVARELFQSLQSGKANLPITSDQITATIRMALQQFQRGVGFKSVARIYTRRGRLAKSPIATEVWGALERFGVVESIAISGVPEGGLAIGEGKKGEVYNFLANALVTGGIREAVEWLQNDLVTKATKVSRA
jgi:hypothetical protein